LCIRGFFYWFLLGICVLGSRAGGLDKLLESFDISLSFVRYGLFASRAEVQDRWVAARKHIKL
jgi:hypothetical protein